MRPTTRITASRPVRATLAALALSLPLALPAGAQIFPGEGEDVDEQAAVAYAALTTTPVGALPPSMTARMVNGARSKGIGFRAQFGHMDEQGDFSRRNLALGIDVALGAATLGITGGYVDYACDVDGAEEMGIEFDCGGAFMFGGNVFAPLVTSPMGTGDSQFMIGLDAALGFSSGEVLDAEFDDGFNSGTINIKLRSFSGAVSLPLALVVRSPGLTLVPHLRPGFGYGRGTGEVETTGDFGEESGESTESGTRMMLGGGVSFLFPNRGIGIEVGMNKVFVEDGDTVIGFGISFGR